MRTPRTADARAFIRRLALSRVDEGYSRVAVARFLGVSDRSVRRWIARRLCGGSDALATRPRSGRPSKLNADQQRQMLDWLEQSPCQFGFATERWTAPRLAHLVARYFGVTLNHRYLNDWLVRHDVTPQIPARRAKERDEAAIAHWLRYVWPQIKKKRVRMTRSWFLPMKVAFCWRR